MSISNNYIPAFSLNTVFTDKDTAEPLSGGTVTFYRDSQRTELKAVWQLTGTFPNYTVVPLPNPMILSANGTLVDAIGNPVIPYFLPYNGGDIDYYYVVVANAGGVEQFRRERVPFVLSSGVTPESSVSFSNELSNPQFVEVNFQTQTPPYTLSPSGAVDQPYLIAPNWDLIVNGSGTIQLTQFAPIGTLNVPTNPAYLLGINAQGVNSVVLRQRFYGSPNLWAGQNISATITGANFSGSDANIIIEYAPSSGTVAQEILNANLPVGGSYQTLDGLNVLLTASANPESAPDAYVDINITIPVGFDIQLTSVQVVTTGATAVQVPYEEESQSRQIDDLFHFYKPSLVNKNLESILVGWDFPVNPAQYSGNTTYSAANLSTTAHYFWDQTILQTSSSTATLARNAVTGGLQITTGANTQAILFCQYLDGQQAKKILNTPLSVNISGWRTSTSGRVIPRVYLLRGSSAATFPTLPTMLGSVANTGVFTLSAANWTEIPYLGLPNPNGELSSVNTAAYATLNDVQDLKYEYYAITDASQISNTDKFAIVVTFECPTTGTVFTIDSISCVQNGIATRPMYKDFAQTLKDCQYYFEKSYSNNVLPGTPTPSDARYERMQLFEKVGTITPVKWHNRSFTINYEYKRIAPTVRFYSTTGAEGVTNWNHLRNFVSLTYTDLANPQNISMAFFTIVPFNDSMQLHALYTSANIVSGTLSSTNLSALDELVMAYHYTLDSRIGK